MVSSVCSGQQAMSLIDTVKDYDKHRILTNFKGAQVSGGWGIANMAVGGAGYFMAKNDEWKYFHEMNAVFGVVNTGFATYNILRCRKQATEKVIAKNAYQHYRNDRKVLLVNLGFDVVCVGAGAVLAQYGNTASSNKEMYKGFGRSLAVQGVFLLALDNLLFASHQKYNSRWAVILEEIRFTGSGFSYVHTFR